MGKSVHKKPNGQPDGAKAFQLATSIERDVVNLNSAISILGIIAHHTAEQLDDGGEVADSLFLVRDLMVKTAENIETARCGIFRATWGFVYGGGK